jgi:hypothetical protein
MDSWFELLFTACPFYGIGEHGFKVFRFKKPVAVPH